MDYTMLLGVSTDYVIAQIILVKLLKKKLPDSFGFLLLILLVVFLEFIVNILLKGDWSMQLYEFLSIIAGCSVGQFICYKFLRSE